MIVLDASMVIAALVLQDEHHANAVGFFRNTTDLLLINPVTLAGVLVAPSREGRLEQVLAELDNLGVTEAPFPPGSARGLAELRATTGLRLPDCIVLFTALDLRATLASFDDRLRRAATDRGVQVHAG